MRRWLILVAIGLAIALVIGMSYFTAQKASVPTNAPTPTTVAVTRGDVQQLVTASGKLVNTRKATLSMGASGQLAKITVHPGDAVHGGEVLAVLDTIDLERQVAQAEQAYVIQQALYSNTLQPDSATVAAAQAAVNGAGAAYRAAQQHFATSPDQVTVSCFNLQDAADALGRARDAYEPLANDFQNRHYDEAQARKAMLEAAQNAYDAALARCNLARNNANDSSVRAAQVQLLEAQKTLSNLISPTMASLIAAHADLESARLALEAARRKLAHATIVAPFDGIVAGVDHQVGDRVSADTSVVSLIDPKALAVEAAVDEKDLALVRTGQVAQLLFDARPELTATGRVERIVPARLSGSQALYPVYLTFDDLPDGLAADMSTDVAIAIASKSNVLRLPRAVVRAKADNTAQVNVWVNDHIEQRSVTTGLRGDVYVEIVDGLKEGDRVVSQ